jgi:hypothetical protein
MFSPARELAMNGCTREIKQVMVLMFENICAIRAPCNFSAAHS